MRKIRFKANNHTLSLITSIEKLQDDISKLLNNNGYDVGEFSNIEYISNANTIDGFLEVDDEIVIKLIEEKSLIISNSFVCFYTYLDWQTVADEDIEKIATDQTSRMKTREMIDYIIEDKMMWMNESQSRYWEELKYELEREKKPTFEGSTN